VKKANNIAIYKYKERGRTKKRKKRMKRGRK